MRQPKGCYRTRSRRANCNGSLFCSINSASCRRGAEMLSSRNRHAAALAVLCGAFGSIANAAESLPAPTRTDTQKFDEMRSFVMGRNEQYYRVTTPNGIDEARYVSIGGIEQYITIRGEVRDNPVIL